MTLWCLEAFQRDGSSSHGKIRFYLSKADDVQNASDVQKVMTQLTQNLCKRPTLNTIALDITTIYVPNENRDKVCGVRVA